MNKSVDETFPVFEIENSTASNMEYMGTKEKFWFDHPELGDCLFKFARPHTGEDWSEKAAEQLAS